MPTTARQALEIFRRYSGKVNRTFGCLSLSDVAWDLFAAAVISNDVLQKFSGDSRNRNTSDHLLQEVMTAIKHDPEKLGKFISALEEYHKSLAQQMKEELQSG